MVNPPPQLQKDGRDPLESIIDRYIENYEFNDGESFHRPSETERLVMKDAFIGLLADEAWDAEWGAHIRGLATRTAALARWPAPLHHIDDAETPEQAWEFWKPLVTNEDGSLNEQAVRDELSDFSMLLRYYSTILCEVTGNRISKETTHPSAVIGVFNDYMQERVEEAVKEELDAGELVSASTAAPAARSDEQSSVHPAAPQTSVPTAAPLQSPCALDRSELPVRPMSDEQDAARYRWLRGYLSREGWMPRELRKTIADNRCTQREIDKCIDHLATQETEGQQ